MKNLRPLGITRDSLMLYVAAAAAAFTFLATMPPPTAWTYQQWMQAGAGVAAYLIGKLQTSPLAGE